MTGDITGAVAAASFWMFIAVVVVAGVAGSSDWPLSMALRMVFWVS